MQLKFTFACSKNTEWIYPKYDTREEAIRNGFMIFDKILVGQIYFDGEKNKIVNVYEFTEMTF